MEEVDDPVEIIPEPTELKRSVCNLREKVECTDCGKKVSKHTLQYGSHKKTCKGKKKEKTEQLEEEKPEIVQKPENIEEEKQENIEQVVEKQENIKEKKPKSQKPAMTKKQVEKPLKQKQVIQRTPEPEPVFFAPKTNWYEQMVMLRNQQAMQRNDAMLAPYQALFQARRGY